MNRNFNTVNGFHSLITTKIIHPDKETDHEHIVGNKQCEEGWCGNEYPKPCLCGGLIHADFGDDTNDGYWIHTMCDKCGR